ncbi:MAG TPA: protein kinase [Pseudolysinimonas sp.]|nr:protein kinase [Pseudolysinimonas sp.]
MDPAPDDDPIPALLGRYRPVSIIGHGGMATVYRATDEALGRDVAVKLYRAAADDDLIRHQDEARVLAQLSHHGLITLLDVGIDDSTPDDPHPFLVMELVEGTNLAEALRQRRFNPREISEIAYDLAEALEYVHAHDVVHRDITPSNVMLVEYGTSAFRTRARLGDFGIALGSTGSRPSGDGDSTTGTAAYLSPEQASRGEITTATDVYSLGLVLLQCFTGRVAFPGDPVTSALARLTADPEVPDDLPDDWTAILRSMLARDPAARPAIAELTVAFRQAVIAASSRHKAGETEPPDEQQRLDAVQHYRILDTEPEGAFDRVTAIAARALGVPIALITILASDRLWFKSRHGTELRQLELLPEVSAQVATHREPWAVPDTTKHARLRTHRLVTGDFGLRACAGAPIVEPGGAVLGMLLAMDTEPHAFTLDDLQTLDDLAAIVMSELTLRVVSRD